MSDELAGLLLLGYCGKFEGHEAEPSPPSGSFVRFFTGCLAGLLPLGNCGKFGGPEANPSLPPAGSWNSFPGLTELPGPTSNLSCTSSKESARCPLTEFDGESNWLFLPSVCQESEIVPAAAALWLMVRWFPLQIWQQCTLPKGHCGSHPPSHQDRQISPPERANL